MRVQNMEIEDEMRRLRSVLRESEARSERLAEELAVIYRAVPMGLCTLDTELRYVRITERLAEMNGLPREAHLGKTPREIVPDICADAERLLRQVLETRQPILGIELHGRSAAAPEVERDWVLQYWPLAI
jgi:PAS domain-containing protein